MKKQGAMPTTKEILAVIRPGCRYQSSEIANKFGVGASAMRYALAELVVQSALHSSVEGKSRKYYLPVERKDVAKKPIEFRPIRIDRRAWHVVNERIADFRSIKSLG